jgi:glycosyltransferase 2 family protein
MILATLPISTWRWAILLRALSIEVPFVPLFRIICISTFVGQISFGAGATDAVRVIYAWRVLRKSSGRIAVSVLADRAIGLFALLAFSAITMLLRWERVREVPELRILTMSVMGCLAVALVLGAMLLVVPSLLMLSFSKLQGPRLNQFLGNILHVLTALRNRPSALSFALLLSLAIHTLTISGFLLVARILQVGNVTLLDIAAAAPLAMVANILPFTPGGLGVGEAAFEQICRWLAPSTLSAPYASVFFAFRAVSMVLVIPGAIAYAMHRPVYKADDQSLSGEELLRGGPYI